MRKSPGLPWGIGITPDVLILTAFLISSPTDILTEEVTDPSEPEFESEVIAGFYFAGDEDDILAAEFGGGPSAA